jgi:threonylcarbamoyladenosine tRNA methylthiotransferase MtaB
MSRAIAFKTLGCRLNQYETDALASEFARAGYRVTPFEETADAYVINTCTVTGISDQKSRQMLNQAARRNPDAVIVVTGCMATRDRDEMEGRSNITYVVDNTRKRSLFALVDGHFRGELLHPRQLPQSLFGYETGAPTVHTRCMLKIQDGCDNFCTFCIIPMVRGRARSRPPAEVLDEARRSLDLGYRELVLTGVNIGRYRDGAAGLDGLLAALLDLPGDFRVRASSMEPDGIDDRFFDLLAHPRMTPHLHLCLQSGSDAILRRMRRMYTVSQYRAMIDAARARSPRCNLTTDVLVGFPGETGEDFDATVDMVREVGFSHVHTFRYSRRPGTRAARMVGHVSEEEKSRRAAVIREHAATNRARYLASLFGSGQRLLVEASDGESAWGYGEHYVPIAVPAACAEPNRFYDVEITGVAPGAPSRLRGAVRVSAAAACR